MSAFFVKIYGLYSKSGFFCFPFYIVPVKERAFSRGWIRRTIYLPKFGVELPEAQIGADQRLLNVWNYAPVVLTGHVLHSNGSPLSSFVGLCMLPSVTITSDLFICVQLEERQQFLPSKSTLAYVRSTYIRFRKGVFDIWSEGSEIESRMVSTLARSNLLLATAHAFQKQFRNSYVGRENGHCHLWSLGSISSHRR